MKLQQDSKAPIVQAKEELTNNALRSFYNAKMKNFDINHGKRALTSAIPLAVGVSDLLYPGAGSMVSAGLIAAGVLGSAEHMKFVKQNADIIKKSREGLRPEEINSNSLKVFAPLKSYKLKNVFNIYYNGICFVFPVAMLAAGGPISFPIASASLAFLTLGAYTKLKATTSKSKMKRVIKENPNLNEEYKLEDIMNDK